MSKLPELTLTKAGASLLAKTPIGSEIPVTKWRIGDGQLPGGEDPRDRTQLVNPVRELPISSVKNDGNQCLIKGQLVNTEMDAFTWRETGLYASDPDDGEILYAYGYEADGAEIPAGATQLREIEFGVELVFDNAANVTAVISKTLVFATLSDLEQTKADAVEEALEQITTSPVAEDLTDSDAFATVTAAGIKRTPLSLLKQVFGKLFAPAPLSKDLTLYVSTTGNDSNDGLSTGTAKRTIQAAVDSIPKNLGGHSVTIEIADGDYTDAGPVSLYGFFGGSSQRGDAPELLFRGASRDGTIVGSISAVLPGIRGCITNLSVSVTDRSSGIYWVGHCRVWRVNVNVTYDGYGYGIGAGDGFMILEDVCSNGPNAAVSTAGILYVNNLSGASVTAIIVGGSSPFAQPAVAIVNNNTVEATSTKYAKYSGAVIFENGVLVE